MTILGDDSNFANLTNSGVKNMSGQNVSNQSDLSSHVSHDPKMDSDFVPGTDGKFNSMNNKQQIIVAL